MDFSFSEEQNMVRELAREILVAEVSAELSKRVEADGQGYHAQLWARLAEANLLGLTVPEAQGGMGFGLAEACVLLEEVGRSLAPAPILPALVAAALPIAKWGSQAQRDEWLAPLAKGELVLTAGLVDAGSANPEKPATQAVHKGAQWQIDGGKRFVEVADRAHSILVPATTDCGTALFVVPLNAEGVRVTGHVLTHKQRCFDVNFDGVVVEAPALLGESDADRTAELRALHQTALVATCAVQVGVSERSIEITSEFLREREQFGVPIGSFQAVQHRMADGYIDLMSMRWTCWRAACALAEGRDAEREAWVAKIWAAEGGSRIASTTMHVHGGHGVDMDYVIHRYFLWSKALELSLGSAQPQLVRLGRDLARSGPPKPF